MNICVQVGQIFGQIFLFLLGIYLWVELLRHRVILWLTCCGTAELLTFPKVALPFFNPTNNVWRFQLPCILISTCSCLFYFSHPSGCEVASYCGFALLSVMTNDVQRIFGEIPIQHFSPFSNWVVFLCCKSKDAFFKLLFNSLWIWHLFI